MEPLERLKLLCDWESEPALDETEVESILNEAAVADDEGNPPTNDNWDPTYNIDRAAAEAWLIKAGKAAAITEIDPPGSGIVTTKVFENCMRMSGKYAARIAMTVSINHSKV